MDKADANVLERYVRAGSDKTAFFESLTGAANMRDELRLYHHLSTHGLPCDNTGEQSTDSEDNGDDTDSHTGSGLADIRALVEKYSTDSDFNKTPLGFQTRLLLIEREPSDTARQQLMSDFNRDFLGERFFYPNPIQRPDPRPPISISSDRCLCFDENDMDSDAYKNSIPFETESYPSEVTLDDASLLAAITNVDDPTGYKYTMKSRLDKLSRCVLPHLPLLDWLARADAQGTEGRWWADVMVRRTLTSLFSWSVLPDIVTILCTYHTLYATAHARDTAENLRPGTSWGSDESRYDDEAWHYARLTLGQHGVLVKACPRVAQQSACGTSWFVKTFEVTLAELGICSLDASTAASEQWAVRTMDLADRQAALTAMANWLRFNLLTARSAVGDATAAKTAEEDTDSDGSDDDDHNDRDSDHDSSTSTFVPHADYMALSANLRRAILVLDILLNRPSIDHLRRYAEAPLTSRRARLGTSLLSWRALMPPTVRHRPRAYAWADADDDLYAAYVAALAPRGFLAWAHLADLFSEGSMKTTCDVALLLAGRASKDTGTNLSPSAFQALESQRTLCFSKDCPTDFAVGEPVNLVVEVKNISALTVHVYELNTVDYLRAKPDATLDEDINLVGLVPTHTRQVPVLRLPPIRRQRVELRDLLTPEKAPSLRDDGEGEDGARSRTAEALPSAPAPALRGVFVVDVLSPEGVCCRAVVRVGGLFIVTRPSPRGLYLYAVNERGEVLADRTTTCVVVDGTQTLVPGGGGDDDEEDAAHDTKDGTDAEEVTRGAEAIGRMRLPFGAASAGGPTTRSVLVCHAGFAQCHTLRVPRETLRLRARMFLHQEQLRFGQRDGTVMVEAQLFVCDIPYAALDVLRKLEVVFTVYDAHDVATILRVRQGQLRAQPNVHGSRGALVVPCHFPKQTTRYTLQLHGLFFSTAQAQWVSVSSDTLSETVDWLEGDEDTRTEDVLLRQDGARAYELVSVGKAGERQGHRVVELTYTSRFTTEEKSLTVWTNWNGIVKVKTGVFSIQKLSYTAKLPYQSQPAVDTPTAFRELLAEKNEGAVVVKPRMHSVRTYFDDAVETMPEEIHVCADESFLLPLPESLFTDVDSSTSSASLTSQTFGSTSFLSATASVTSMARTLAEAGVTFVRVARYDESLVVGTPPLLGTIDSARRCLLVEGLDAGVYKIHYGEADVMVRCVVHRGRRWPVATCGNSAYVRHDNGIARLWNTHAWLTASVPAVQVAAKADRTTTTTMTTTTTTNTAAATSSFSPLPPLVSPPRVMLKIGCPSSEKSAVRVHAFAYLFFPDKLEAMQDAMKSAKCATRHHEDTNADCVLRVCSATLGAQSALDAETLYTIRRACAAPRMGQTLEKPTSLLQRQDTSKIVVETLADGECPCDFFCNAIPLDDEPQWDALCADRACLADDPQYLPLDREFQMLDRAAALCREQRLEVYRQKERRRIVELPCADYNFLPSAGFSGGWQSLNMRVDFTGAPADAPSEAWCLGECTFDVPPLHNGYRTLVVVVESGQSSVVQVVPLPSPTSTTSGGHSFPATATTATVVETKTPSDAATPTFATDARTVYKLVAPSASRCRLAMDAPRYAIWNASTLYTALSRARAVMSTPSSDTDTWQAWHFLTRWQRLTPRQKLLTYDRFASHELNLFTYFQDRPFFNAVVASAVASKSEKQLIDHLLLDERTWVATHYLSDASVARVALAHLHVMEKALIVVFLAATHHEACERLCASLTERGPGVETIVAACLAPVSDAVLPKSELDDDGLANVEEDTEEDPEDDVDVVVGPAGTARSTRDSGGANAEENADAPWSGTVGSTSEFVERQYLAGLHAPDCDTVSSRAFWIALAAHAVATTTTTTTPEKRVPFLSETIALTARHSCTGVIAMAVCGLLERADAPAAVKPIVTGDDTTTTITAQAETRCLVLTRVRHTTPVDARGLNPEIHLYERFFDPELRYAFDAVEEKMVRRGVSTFTAGRMYEGQINVLNGCDYAVELEVRASVPHAAIAMRLGTRQRGNTSLTWTVTVPAMSSLATPLTYYFYFPHTGTFTHRPCLAVQEGRCVAVAGWLVSHAAKDSHAAQSPAPALRALPVSAPPTHWCLPPLSALEKILYEGSADSVWALVEQQELKANDPRPGAAAKTAPAVEYIPRSSYYCQLRNKTFYLKAIALLESQQRFDAVVWSFSVHHADTAHFMQFLLYRLLEDQAAYQGLSPQTPSAPPPLPPRVIGWSAPTRPLAAVKGELLYVWTDSFTFSNFTFKDFSPLVSARTHDLSTMLTAGAPDDGPDKGEKEEGAGEDDSESSWPVHNRGYQRYYRSFMHYLAVKPLKYYTFRDAFFLCSHLVTQGWTLSGENLQSTWFTLLPFLDDMDKHTAAAATDHNDASADGTTAEAARAGQNPAEESADPATHMSIQRDYLRGFLELVRNGSPPFHVAKDVCLKHLTCPLLFWRNLFVDMQNFIDEADGVVGAEPATTSGEPSDRAPTGEPYLTCTLEPAQRSTALHSSQLRVVTENVRTFTVSLYPIDVERLFSHVPFGCESVTDAIDFNAVRPRQTLSVVVTGGPTVGADQPASDGATIRGLVETVVPMPDALASTNLIVKVTAASGADVLSTTLTYYPNAMTVLVSRHGGRVTVLDKATQRGLPKVYIKSFVRCNNGTVTFFRDGYTDLRGAFDYACASDQVPLADVAEFAILILSAEHGGLVRRAKPPGKAATLALV